MELLGFDGPHGHELSVLQSNAGSIRLGSAHRLALFTDRRSVDRRLTRPLLRSPEQGADTIVWLAGAHVPTGRFWLDRRARETVRLPWLSYTDQEVERTFAMVASDAGVVEIPTP